MSPRTSTQGTFVVQQQLCRCQRGSGSECSLLGGPQVSLSITRITQQCTDTQVERGLKNGGEGGIQRERDTTSSMGDGIERFLDKIPVPVEVSPSLRIPVFLEDSTSHTTEQQQQAERRFFGAGVAESTTATNV